MIPTVTTSNSTFKKPQQRRDPRRPLANRVVILDVSSEREMSKLKTLVNKLGGRVSETLEANVSTATYVGIVSDSVLTSNLRNIMKSVSSDHLSMIIDDLNNISSASHLDEQSTSTNHINRTQITTLRDIICRSSPLLRGCVLRRVRLLTVRMFTERALELVDLQAKALNSHQTGCNPPVNQTVSDHVTMITAPFVYMGDLTGVHAPLVREVNANELAMHLGADLHLCRYKSVFDEPSNSTQSNKCGVEQLRSQPKLHKIPSNTGEHKTNRRRSNEISLERQLSPLKDRSAYCGVCKMSNLDLNKHIDSNQHKAALKTSGIYEQIDEYVFSKHPLIPSLHMIPAAVDDEHGNKKTVKLPLSGGFEKSTDSGVQQPESGTLLHDDETTTKYLNTESQRAQLDKFTTHNERLEAIETRKYQRLNRYKYD